MKNELSIKKNEYQKKWTERNIDKARELVRNTREKEIIELKKQLDNTDITEYRRRYLSTADKNELCNYCNLIYKSGHGKQIRWVAIKKWLTELGYKVEDKRIKSGHTVSIIY